MSIKHGLTVDQEANAFRDVSLKPNFSAWFVSFGERSCAVLRSWSSTGHGDGGPKLFCNLLSRALTGACDPELFLQFVDLAKAKGALAMATQIVMITTAIADTISTQRM
jgi:hypothetical protein